MEPDEGRAGDYPAALMFADLRLPSYGLYIDKADAVTLSNVRFPLISGTEEVRPAVYDSRTDAVIAGLVEPPDTGRKGRNLKGNPVWEARFRTLKSVADGTTQPFYWYDPGADEPVPLLVSLHSWGASCRWSALAVRTAAYCETNGWAFAYPNYRGPNVRPEACGSELAVQDVLDVIDWAKAVRKILKDGRDVTETPAKGPHNTFQGFGKYKDGPVNREGAVKDYCIDYIYVSEGTRVLDFATHDDKRPGTDLYPSDHYPVTATVVLP